MSRRARARSFAGLALRLLHGGRWGIGRIGLAFGSACTLDGFGWLPPHAMQILIHDHHPGAGPSRAEYLQSRCQRVLGVFADRLTSVTLTIGTDPTDADRCEARLSVATRVGRTHEAVARRRTLPTTLAEVFDAVVVQLSAQGLRPRTAADEDEDGERRSAAPGMRRASTGGASART